jgi:hypothetical protein
VVHPDASVEVHDVHVPAVTTAQSASQPFVALPSPLTFPASHVIVVHPDASLEVHDVHVPAVTTAQPASQPFVASSSASNLPASHVTAVHPDASLEVHDVHVPAVTTAQFVFPSVFNTTTTIITASPRDRPKAAFTAIDERLFLPGLLVCLSGELVA